MSKGETQKRSEELQNQNQALQLAYNQWMMGQQRQFLEQGNQRQAEWDNYWRTQLQPRTQQLMDTGFVDPNQRALLRRSAAEDTARQFTMAEQTGRSRLGQAGYRSDAPSGMMPRFNLGVNLARGETLANQYRGIDANAASRQFAAIPLAGQMANQFMNPLPYYGFSQNRSPGAVQNMAYQPGFWEKVGPELLTGAVNAAATPLAGWMPTPGK